MAVRLLYLALGLLLIAVLSIARHAGAETYSPHPITLGVPFPAGEPTEASA